MFRRLHLLVLAACACAFAFSAHAVWYIPDFLDADSTNRPPRLHRLLEKANDYIETAEDEALNGNDVAAIENYKKALIELDAVERKNPDRAETAEFAPLRSKRATCLAAIDSIRFTQINENERAVAVTDVTELRKKWQIKHDPVAAAAAAREEAKRRSEKEKAQDDRARTDTDFKQRLAAATAAIRNGDYETADRNLAGLEKKYPDNLNLLLARAAVQTGLGNPNTARRTLEMAASKHPDSYIPFYNLAALTLQQGGKLDEARLHYVHGRRLGGPQNVALEELLKGKAESKSDDADVKKNAGDKDEKNDDDGKDQKKGVVI